MFKLRDILIVDKEKENQLHKLHPTRIEIISVKSKENTYMCLILDHTGKCNIGHKTIFTKYHLKEFYIKSF